MSREKYFSICEQLGKEPNPEKIPPDLNDFPELMRNAIETFNRLGDRVYPDIGYVGKDYTLLDYYLDICGVDDSSDLEFFLDILSWLDSRAIQRSAKEIKQELEKLKRKSNG